MRGVCFCLTLHILQECSYDLVATSHLEELARSQGRQRECVEQTCRACSPFALAELPASLLRDLQVDDTLNPSGHRFVTAPLCLSYIRIVVLLSTSQTLTVASADAEMSSLPSALVCSAVTFFLCVTNPTKPGRCDRSRSSGAGGFINCNACQQTCKTVPAHLCPRKAADDADPRFSSQWVDGVAAEMQR